MALKKTSEPVERSRLRDTGIADFHARKVIGDQYPAGFAIETDEIS
jgi:hypothetical protein